MRTLITGATGVLGKQLLERIEQPVILTRNAARARRDWPTAEVHSWEPESGPAPADAVHDVDVVFNLAGEPVAGGRWTKEKKRRIYDSRVVGTRNLVTALAAAPPRPRVLVSASAVGYYGDRGDTELDESAASGDDFLSDVCASWEREAMAASRFGIRVVCARIGLVLALGGGALGQMIGPFRMGVGGRLGDGRQWMPWIHMNDAIGLLLHASRNGSLQGPVNTVAPNPVTNADFTRALGRAIRRPTILPMPKIALRIAFGEMGEAVIASQRALPHAAKRSGYVFEYENLPEALDSLQL